jgi:predicted Zn-dependent peptidase
MRGHARDAETFIGMLGDIVQHSVFPADELARERQVLMQEYAEDEDDPMATAFKLFDKACYGEHAAAQPVIGSRANIRRFTRDDLAGFVASRYTGANTVVGVTGRVDPDRIVEAARAAFGDMPRGEANRITAPAFVGGVRSRRLPGADQVHIVLGFPVPGMAEEHDAFRLAAALFGEGMSSPLLDRLRERRGLVYHADCSTDVRDVYGQFVVEASTMSQHLDEFFVEVTRLLHRQAEVIDPVDLERARNQLAVRTLFVQEAPEMRLELAAVDLFALGRVRPQEEHLAGIAAVSAAQVREAVAQMLEAGAAVGLAGKIARGAEDRVAALRAKTADQRSSTFI